MDRRTRSSLILLVLVVGVVGFILLLQAAVSGGDPPVAAPATVAEGEAATVIGISDGDTIRVRLAGGWEERVRYIGVDAPELSHPGDGIVAECFGNESTEANRELVANRDVVLERDVSDRDRNGRLLRHVWVPVGQGWLLVTEALVRDGYADARSYRPDTRWDDELAAAEGQARDALAGMWGAC